MSSFLYAQTDTTDTASKDSAHFPVEDRRGYKITASNIHPFGLDFGDIIKDSVYYDPAKNEYYIYEQINGKDYRMPIALSPEEMMRLQERRLNNNYFYERNRSLDLINYKQPRPRPYMSNKMFTKLFGLTPGGKKIEIYPTGSISLSAGYQGQKVDNPTLSEEARRNGNFDFRMNSNLGLMAEIGNRLKLPISYNTLSTFDFQNQMKLQFSGHEDAILRRLEAGNISFENRSNLLPSVQNLFGLKTQLQFGKLFITTAVANSRSERQSMNLQGGALSQQVKINLGDYDENRHFLLGDYFRANYNKTMAEIPLIRSQVQLIRVEVWVTNRNFSTDTTRDVVALMDLGENDPYNTNIQSTGAGNLPNNAANDLYSSLAQTPSARNASTVTTLLASKGLQPVQDYEKTYARKLGSNEYFINSRAGFISLNQQLQPDDVLAVAYQYAYNGRIYQVGEFSNEVSLDSSQGVQKILFLKLLKATAQRVNLPIWQWMMKNVYSLETIGLEPDNFNLNVYYKEPSAGVKRYLPEVADVVEGKSLLSLLNTDRLNVRQDPIPDGQFDFVPGYTVLPQQGKIIFPLLEPYARDVDSIAINGMPQEVKDQYVYYHLYDSIKAIATTYSNLDRFLLQGTVKGSNSSSISLGALNIPRGSIRVTAGGQTLVENTDYIINYEIGELQIINPSILASGLPVNVQYENNGGMSSYQRNFFGMRLDYHFNNRFSIGGSVAQLKETPYLNKINFGDDPVNNRMYGIDYSFRSELPYLTYLLDKLPFYTTTAQSAINTYGEAAFLQPGHSSQIGHGRSGQVFIDDFESASNIYDLRFPFSSWALASTPAGNGLFPEADLKNNLDYGKNRAKIAWYNIEPSLQSRTSSNASSLGLSELSDPRVRAVYVNELFPQKTNEVAGLQTPTFDIAYYPSARGHYNYTNGTSEMDAQGNLLNPQKRWGGIMRAMEQSMTDFETSNIEYIEFWMQDPFIKNPNSRGGKFIINLGNVSEDILKDGKHFYENGMNTPAQPTAVDSSGVWGKTPVNPIQITNAFSNTAEDRPLQDVGFDGLNDESETTKFGSYLQVIQQNFGTNSTAYLHAAADPSSDNYKWYRDPSYANAGILERYKNFNNPEGNSPIAANNEQISSAATNYPDKEDLNGDNSINESEQYFEYEIDLYPGKAITDKYIADVSTIQPKLANDSVSTERWYLYRIPVKEFTNKVGNITDFKSIRFMRMYLTDFQDSVVLRFARLGFVRNQWRSFRYELDTTGSYRALPANSNTTLNLSSVNTDDNSGKSPIPYVAPPGVERMQSLANNGAYLRQNEQSLSLKIENLKQKEARAIFKNVRMDMRQYGQLSMFIHAESLPGQSSVANGDLEAVVRIGQDFLSNYYEVRIPLRVTQHSMTVSAEEVWPFENNLDIILQDLINLKLERNSSRVPINEIFRRPLGNKSIAVMGNPNFGEVDGFLVGIENARGTQSLSAEVWINELRLSRMDETGGMAAQGRVDLQLADLGTLSISANTYTAGFGSIEQRVNERKRENLIQFDATANINAGKLIPPKINANIPVFFNLNQTVYTPKYDPFDQDVLFKYKMNNTESKRMRDSIRNIAQDRTTTKMLGLNGVKFGKPSQTPKPWDISNLDFSYTFTSIDQTNPLIDRNLINKHFGSISYMYAGKPFFIEPFKQLIQSKNPWLKWLTEFNINVVPSTINVRAAIDRQYGEFTPRIVNIFDAQNQIDRLETTYDKYFRFNRDYNLVWNLTKSLNVNFVANNFAFVDEPYGALNTPLKKDTLWKNFLKGGRNTMYQQKATASYAIPFDKLPATSWITGTLNYTADYKWIGASLLAKDLGNVIENSSTTSINAELNFRSLYERSNLLKSAYMSREERQQQDSIILLQSENKNNNAQQDSLVKPPKRSEYLKGKTGADRRKALREWRKLAEDYRIKKSEARKNKKIRISSAVSVPLQVVTMVKQVSVNYSNGYRSRVPGYMDSTKFVGQNWSTMQPGMDYVFGKQPDARWLQDKAQRGLLSRNQDFNDMFRQSYVEELQANLTLEPVKDLIIDVNLRKSFVKEYSELFKDTLGAGRFEHLSPYSSGSFDVSYIGLKTFFQKDNPLDVPQLFRNFSAYRLPIAQRLASNNAYYTGDIAQDGYPKGYGRYAQNVLIPAFLAAYLGKDPNSIALMAETNRSIKTNPLQGIIPLPNWSFTYMGLSTIPFMAKLFNDFSIRHAYNGGMAMNSFSSAMFFNDPLMLGVPGFIDPVSGNYVPYFLVPNLTMQQHFSPLLGVDMSLKDQSNFRFQYAKSRMLSLSLVNYQVSEVNSTEISFGGSVRKKINLHLFSGIDIPTKLTISKDKNTATPNLFEDAQTPEKEEDKRTDINVGIEFSMRDDMQANNILDQTNGYRTGGQKVISISPNIGFILNRRVNFNFYFSQQRNIPYVSTTPPITTTRGGLEVKILLSQ